MTAAIDITQWMLGLGVPLGVCILLLTVYFVVAAAERISLHSFAHSTELDRVAPRYRVWMFATIALDAVQYSAVVLAGADLPFTSHASTWPRVLHGFILVFTENSFTIVFFAMLAVLPLPFLYRVVTRSRSTGSASSAEPWFFLWSAVESSEAAWYVWFHSVAYDTLGFCFLSVLFKTFSCTFPSDGHAAVTDGTQSVLVAQPSIVCFTPYHDALVAVAVPLVVWVYGNLVYAEVFDSTAAFRGDDEGGGGGGGALVNSAASDAASDKDPFKSTGSAALEAPLMVAHTLRFDTHPLFAVLQSAWKVVVAAVSVYFYEHAAVRVSVLLLALVVLLTANLLIAPCQIVQINYLRTCSWTLALWAALTAAATLVIDDPGSWTPLILYAAGSGVLLILAVVGWCTGAYVRLGVAPGSTNAFGRELDGVSQGFARTRARTVILFVSGCSVGCLFLLVGTLLERHEHGGWVWLSLLPYAALAVPVTCCSRAPDPHVLNPRWEWLVIRDFCSAALLTSAFGIAVVLYHVERCGWLSLMCSCLAHCAFIASLGGLFLKARKDE